EEGYTSRVQAGRVPRQQRGLRDPLPLDDRDEPHGHLGGRQRVPAR
ncbi:MAG: LSU ribosomal protein L31p @ LSU ribosomal protein L31p, zinc-independent, partial [uncultured Rubrobacteraceae bacterium]